MAIVPAMIALTIMLVFVFQNLQDSTISFFGFSGVAPLGLLLVGASLLGGLVVFLLGSVRIIQLRKLARGRQQRP